MALQVHHNENVLILDISAGGDKCDYNFFFTPHKLEPLFRPLNAIILFLAPPKYKASRDSDWDQKVSRIQTKVASFCSGKKSPFVGDTKFKK